ncbi:MAG: DUF2490 domain-containing protein [Pyrinomonadaceae bacterium]|nr:DUF2490 domain-containing protein [Pyrinomonadaceae bacterium]
MKIILLTLSTFFALAIGESTAAQETPNDTEFNIWTDLSITMPLVKRETADGKKFDKLSLTLNSTLRLGRDNLRPVDERIGMGLNYRVNKYLSLSPDIFYRGAQPFKGGKGYETRVRFAATVQNKWSNFSIDDRNQVEYRFRNSKKNDVRYKNRLRLKVPVRKNGKEIFTPFASTEPYYNITTKKFTRNELLVGASKSINKNFGTDIYYVLVNDRDFPKTVHGAGISLKIKID